MNKLEKLDEFLAYYKKMISNHDPYNSEYNSQTQNINLHKSKMGNVVMAKESISLKQQGEKKDKDKKKIKKGILLFE